MIIQIRKELQELREKSDQRETEIREAQTSESREAGTGEIAVRTGPLGIKASDNLADYWKHETERKYKLNQDKIRELDLWLPRLSSRSASSLNFQIK